MLEKQIIITYLQTVIYKYVTATLKYMFVLTDPLNHEVCQFPQSKGLA